MGRRVGLVLSGCGHLDGSDIREVVLTHLALSRANVETVFMAPDVGLPVIVDHLSRAPGPGERRALVEAARIARDGIQPLSEVKPEALQALIIPGGAGIGTVLSDYDARHEICEVNADLARLLRGMVAGHKPMGFVGLAPILAARVLGPSLGVRVTFGARGSGPSKHAAIMGADVRPCLVDDVMLDRKARVVSTPAHLFEGQRLTQVAGALDKMVRMVLSLAPGVRQPQNGVEGPARPPSRRDDGPRPPQPAPRPENRGAQPPIVRRRGR
jgi:enhancing lycopene biosynthesis protein 2